MSATQNSTKSIGNIFCPKCGTANAAGARFCAGCGGAMSSGSFATSSPPTLPMGNMLWSSAESMEVDADVSTVLASARELILQRKGEVDRQSANEIVGKLSFSSSLNTYIPVRFVVAVAASPLGAGRSSVKATASVDWAASVLLIIVASTLTGILAVSQGLIWLVVAVLYIPLQKLIASQVVRALLKVRPGTAIPPVAPMNATIVSEAPVAARHTPQNNAAVKSPDDKKEKDIFADLRRLAELRDFGAISIEDFETKKAELLKKI